jgi:5-hydroxyisourate hydrolase
MSAITTHVLDTSRGRPAARVPIVLELDTGASHWRAIGRGETDNDGRARELMPDGAALVPGTYRLTFDTRSYFETQGAQVFYPQVVVVFEVAPGEPHYHLPLLLSPFGYSTYRGS